MCRAFDFGFLVIGIESKVSHVGVMLKLLGGKHGSLICVCLWCNPLPGFRIDLSCFDPCQAKHHHQNQAMVKVKVYSLIWLFAGNGYSTNLIHGFRASKGSKASESLGSLERFSGFGVLARSGEEL